jgi:hypothetical protein
MFTSLPPRARNSAMIVDDRMLHGAVPWHSFMRPGGERKAAFRSKRLVAEDMRPIFVMVLARKRRQLTNTRSRRGMDSFGYRRESPAMETVAITFMASARPPLSPSNRWPCAKSC